MNCRDNESLILAERDGALTKEQLAVLSDHVAACPACARLRQRLGIALDAYQAGIATVAIPDADEAWRDLRDRLRDRGTTSPRRRRLAPMVWFGGPLVAAAALAFAFVTIRPKPAMPSDPAVAAMAAPLYDPSTIAGADFVEAGDPNASTIVYVDKESGWLVVWASGDQADKNG